MMTFPHWRSQDSKDIMLKKFILSSTFLVALSLTACTTPTTTSASPGSTHPTSLPHISTLATSTPITTSKVDEEAEVRDLVENFGKKLQSVSLLAPDAAQEMQNQYADFVSPTLLEMWVNDPLKAPGRMVSSPWPDRIEITTLERETSDRYVINGYIVEVTSKEIVSGGAASKIPVYIVVEKDQGGWLITEYTEKH